MSINKNHLLKKIIESLEMVLQNALSATEIAHESATNKNNIAENKYDTLGLEAAYLAHGQSQRVQQCQLDLIAYKDFLPHSFEKSEIITVGALIFLLDDGVKKNIFLGPASGGLKFEFDQKEILIITTSAPLGKALLGSRVDDEIKLNIGGNKKYYEVLSIA
ncbi:MAG: GreA/GreB family elongation factor [Methylococcales bacterium]